MDGKPSLVDHFGGPRRVMILSVLLILGVGYYRWQTVGSGDAISEVGRELGLQYERVSQRSQLRGRIGDIGVAVDTTTGNSAGDTKWFTDFKIYAPDQPHGKIIGASVRQKLIGKMKESEWLKTGDADFDKAILVSGSAEEILPRLNPEARPAVLAAVEEGWELDGVTWKARKSGRLTSAEKIRSVLDLGLAAAKATRGSAPPPASEEGQAGKE